MFTSPAVRFLPEMAQSVVIPIRYPSIRPLLLRTQTIRLRAPIPRSVTVGGPGTTVMAATAGEISGSSTKPVSVIVSVVSGASRAIREPWPAVKPAVSQHCGGPALVARHLLDQLGQSYGEISRKIREPLGSTKRGHSGDHLSNGGIASRRDLIA